MKPLVVFADPVEAIINYLAGKLASRSESHVLQPQPVEVSAWYPHESTPELPSIPHVQVNNDGTFEFHYPVAQRATVRITIWHDNPTPARQLASLVSGLMQTHPGDADVWSVTLLTGPLPNRDKDTGAYLVSMTFRVNIRPTEVAS